MSVLVPTPLPSTGGWALYDWLDKGWASAPAAAGIATVTLDPLPDVIRWQLTHVVIGCTSAAPTKLRLYLDSVANPGLRDGSDTGNFDVADWAMGLMVPPGRSLIARWTGCTDGAVGTINIQANILRLTG